MHDQSSFAQRDPLPVRATRWTVLALRMLMGLFMIASALLGRETDPGGPHLAAVGLIAFGAVYLYLQDWRAVLAAVLTSALLHAEGPAVGAGAGLALGLWSWLAFHLCTGPVRTLIAMRASASRD